MKIYESQIQCADSFTLSATVYHPTKIKAAVLIAPATGIKKGFYHAFAKHLASNSYGVICYDNRGIGASKKGNINAANASLITWGSFDMSAAFETLKTAFPNKSYHLVGHSAGGQLVGLVENSNEFSSMFNFASSSGSLQNMRYPFKFSAVFFLKVYIPLNNLFFAKTNSQWVGMGEPLPKEVANQWKKWCSGKGYVKVDFGKKIKRHYYNEISFPSMWVHATDDGIANLENVKDMIRVFPNSKSEIQSLNPKKLGFKEIGHMKFFSSKYLTLWKYATDWLDLHSDFTSDN